MICAACAAVASVDAVAQDPGPVEIFDEETPVVIDDVLVTGRAFETLTRDFAASASAPARNRGLARWAGAVCIGAVNFTTDNAHLIVDRISLVAESLGISLAEPGCVPNLVIVGATDGSAMAREMVRRQRRHFFRYGYTHSNRGSAALEEFQRSSAAVRWWHLSLPIITGTNVPAIRLPGEEPGPSVCRTRSGYWKRNCDQVTDRIIRLLVIVDVDQFEGMNFDQLSDYLVMIALAQIEPDADYTPYDTVLNLFNPSIAVTGLTEWDQTYLRALYTGPDENLTSGELAARMAAALRGSATAAAAQ